MTRHELSILIPTYNSDCTALTAELCRQASSINRLKFELIVADDGSPDRTIAERNHAISTLPYCRFIDRRVNSGRAAIRNFLASEAQYKWLLFLDSDMTITRSNFVEQYLRSEGTIVYGGYTVGKGETSNLRHLYEKKCEPHHTVEERRKHPFLHFHTGNFMVSRQVLAEHPFDERFRFYGYEDVLWGKQLHQADLEITHIDNPAGFYTFEDNIHFIEKTEEGLRTLYKFQHELSGYSQLLTYAESIRHSPVHSLMLLWHRLFSSLERRYLCGKHPSLTVFSVYKLGYYLLLDK